MPRGDDYPIPAYAAYIWTTPDAIHLGLPGPGARTSTTRLPNSPEGFSIALAILRERGRPQASLAIATPAAPTQWEVDQWLRANKKMPLSSDPQKALEELGL